ncbi:MAG: preprotein translocase subunit SecE [Desulfovibrio sp.]|jgi:preprotein translocase subunit SecE|nr:preprotein translocase subunit SecE [Desulfovibrio sp.]
MAEKQKKQAKTALAGGKAQSAAVLQTAGPGARLRNLGRYFEDAKTELGKVSWPTRRELKATSFAVLILVVVMSIFLGLADLALSKLMEAILSIGL